MSDSNASSNRTQAQPQTSSHDLPKPKGFIKVNVPKEMKAGSRSYAFISEWTWDDPLAGTEEEINWKAFGKVFDKDGGEVPIRDTDLKSYYTMEKKEGLQVFTIKLMTVFHLKSELKTPGTYKFCMELALWEGNRTTKEKLESEFTVKEDIQDSSIRPSDEELQYVRDVTRNSRLHREFEHCGFLFDFKKRGL